MVDNRPDTRRLKKESGKTNFQSLSNFLPVHTALQREPGEPRGLLELGAGLQGQRMCDTQMDLLIREAAEPSAEY